MEIGNGNRTLREVLMSRKESLMCSERKGWSREVRLLKTGKILK